MVTPHVLSQEQSRLIWLEVMSYWCFINRSYFYNIIQISVISIEMAGMYNIHIDQSDEKDYTQICNRISKYHYSRLESK